MGDTWEYIHLVQSQVPTECQYVPGCEYAPVHKTEHIPPFRMLTESGQEMIPKGKSNTQMHAMINCGKNYKGILQGVMSENGSRMAPI